AYQTQPGGGREIHSTVSKLRTRFQVVSQALELDERRIPRDAAECNHDSHACQCVELAIEVNLAVANLRGQRPVAGRRATRRGEDVGILERQPIVDVVARDLVGEAGGFHRREEELARGAASIPREDSARAVAAVCRRREPYDEQARAGIAEPRHGPAPVRLMAEGRALLTRDL